MRKAQVHGKSGSSAAAEAQLRKSHGLSGRVATKLDSRSVQLAQAKLIDTIQNGPCVVAQREKMESMNQHLGTSMVQRAADEEELQAKANPAQLAAEEEELQAKADPAQLKEEEELQGKFVTAQMQGHEEEPAQSKMATTQLAEGQTASKGNQTGLPDNLKSGIESLSGMSMDSVQVHYNSDKPAQLNALAYAQGSNIHVGPGQEKHVPHEAWHVVQQAQGRVNPTKETSGGTQINDDKSLETEADVMGAKAAQFKAASGSRTSR
tara:strand:- start:135 stop:929 length:795 start_codon:yes stop_codon:yes gene_type:complete